MKDISVKVLVNSKVKCWICSTNLSDVLMKNNNYDFYMCEECFTFLKGISINERIGDGTHIKFINPTFREKFLDAIKESDITWRDFYKKKKTKLWGL